MMISDVAVRRAISGWKNELNAMGHAWQAIGAGTLALVSVATPETPLFSVPSVSLSPAWSLSALLPFRHHQGLHLCVAQIPVGFEARCQNLLEEQAAIVAGFIKKEVEVEALTTELVYYQDLVLAMYDLNDALSRPLDLSQMLEALLDHLCRLTDAAGGIALLMHPHRIVHTYHSQMPESEIDVYFDHLLKNGERLSAALQGGDQLLCFPLHTPEHDMRIEGMIGLISHAPLQSPQIKLAQAVIQQAGSHLQNISHFEERVAQTRLQTEVELARTVQSDLLPRKPIKLPGLDVYGESRAAFDVGGDFFDFFTGQNGAFMFSLGDVSGKGLSAALVMTMTRTAIRSAALLAPTPRTIMKFANRNLYDDYTELGKLTTAFIGKCDADYQHIMFANAGHAPVVYTDSETPAFMLRADAPPLGVLPTYEGGSETIELPPNGLLIVATDGFVEAENEAGEMFGYDHFLSTIDSLKHLSAAEISHALYEHIENFSGSVPQHDDLTIIVIKRTADPESMTL